MVLVSLLGQRSQNKSGLEIRILNLNFSYDFNLSYYL